MTNIKLIVHIALLNLTMIMWSQPRAFAVQKSWDQLQK